LSRIRGTLHEKYPLAQLLKAVFRNLTDFGASLRLKTVSTDWFSQHLSWTKRVKHPSEVPEKGREGKSYCSGN